MAGKSKFQKGQIVRRKLHSGTPIGPYMQIMHIEQDKVYCDIIGKDNPNIALFKDNVYVYSQISLMISDEMLKRLKQGKTICVSHPITVKWEKAYKENPELVHFYSQKGKIKPATFYIEQIKKQVLLRELVISIIVDKMIL